MRRSFWKNESGDARGLWQRWEALTAAREENRALELVYLAALALWLLHVQCKLPAWTETSRAVGDVGAMLCLDAAFLLSLLCAVCALLRILPGLPGLALGAVCAAGGLVFWPRLSYAPRCWCVILVLILEARGKRFDSILRVWLAVYAAGLAVSLLGLAAGYTTEVHKWQRYGTGFALGYANANNMSRMLLWMAMLAWLLTARSSRGRTALLFLPVLAVTAFVARCRTAAAMALLIPAAAMLPGRGRPPARGGRVLLSAAPFFFLALSLVLSYALIPLIPYVRTGFFWNFFSRFVQNNIALREYGVTLRGQWVDFLGHVSREFFGERIYLTILDNAYVPWLLRNGVPRTALLLGALSAALYRAIRHADRPLVIAFLAILLYGMMEPAAVQPQYNFAFFYLFAVPAERGGRVDG